VCERARVRERETEGERMREKERRDREKREKKREKQREAREKVRERGQIHPIRTPEFSSFAKITHDVCVRETQSDCVYTCT